MISIEYNYSTLKVLYQLEIWKQRMAVKGHVTHKTCNTTKLGHNYLLYVDIPAIAVDKVKSQIVTCRDFIKVIDSLRW